MIPVQAAWVVGDQTVYNQFEANHLAFRSGGPAYRFKFLEEYYANIDWTQEPQGTWQQLCADHARQIRSRYRKLKLLFSAGRDSGHIFQVFETAGIPIDELIVTYSPYHPTRNWEFHNIIQPIAQELCRRNPGMRLTTVCQDQSWYEKIWDRERWFTDRPHQRSMLFTSYDYNDLIEQDPDYQSGTCGYMIGLEKPRIRLQDGNYVCQMLDTMIQFCPLNIANVEYFHWAPENPAVFVKQAWMLVNYLEQHYPNADAEFVDRFQNTFSGYYDQLCTALGRGPAMAWQVGDGRNKVHNNYAPAIQQVIRTAQQQDWRCWKEYSLLVDDLARNHAHHFNNNDPQMGSIGIWGRAYRLKTQNKCLDLPG